MGDMDSMHMKMMPIEDGDPLIYMATTDSSWSKGRVSAILPSGHVIQQFGDADDATADEGPRLKYPHALAISPRCSKVVVPELSKRIAQFTRGNSTQSLPSFTANLIHGQH